MALVLSAFVGASAGAVAGSWIAGTAWALGGLYAGANSAALLTAAVQVSTRE